MNGSYPEPFCVLGTFCTQLTLGTDEAYDVEDLVRELQSMKATPREAQNTKGRASAIDGRRKRHAGYAVSERTCKRIEEPFGWIKALVGKARTKFRGRDRVGSAFELAAASYSLARLPLAAA